MTRYAIDSLTAIRILRDGRATSNKHQLVAPKSLQSHAMTHLYRDVRSGALDREEARAILDGITTMRIRLLGDRVSRGQAWRIAEELNWAEIGYAEYVAVAKLQADAFVTLNEKLASDVQHIVVLAPYEALFTD